MSAVTDQKPSRSFQWLQMWLSKARPLTPSLMPTDYQSLTLDIAAASESSMRDIVHRCQQRLRYLLRDHSLQLAIALPATEQAATLITAADKAAQQDWLTPVQHHIRQLRHRAAAADTVFNTTLSGAGRTAGREIFLQTLALKGETEPGWLAVVSSLNEYDKESLHSLTRPMRDAFARGLSLYCQRQREIRQSLHSERRAQAAELHDSLAQVLGYMRIRSARLQTLMDETCVQPHMKTISDDLADQTLVAYRQVRELIRTSRLNLREQSLDQMFINALEEFEQHSAIVFQLDNRCPDLSVNHRQLTQLSYIVREALANIVRHSHASHARIRLFRKHNKVRLTIEDNGRGIDRNQARSDSYGLTIMQERASSIAARCQISNRQGGGTRVEITFRTQEEQPA